MGRQQGVPSGAPNGSSGREGTGQAWRGIDMKTAKIGRAPSLHHACVNAAFGRSALPLT
jgi:hypothetical protein